MPVEEEAARTLTQLVVETREVMRNELRPMLAARGLTPEAIETFVKTVLPGGKPKRRR